LIFTERGNYFPGEFPGNKLTEHNQCIITIEKKRAISLIKITKFDGCGYEKSNIFEPQNIFVL